MHAARNPTGESADHITLARRSRRRSYIHLFPLPSQSHQPTSLRWRAASVFVPPQAPGTRHRTPEFRINPLLTRHNLEAGQARVAQAPSQIAICFYHS